MGGDEQLINCRSFTTNSQDKINIPSYILETHGHVGGVKTKAAVGIVSPMYEFKQNFAV